MTEQEIRNAQAMQAKIGRDLQKSNFSESNKYPGGFSIPANLADNLVQVSGFTGVKTQIVEGQRELQSQAAAANSYDIVIKSTFDVAKKIVLFHSNLPLSAIATSDETTGDADAIAKMGNVLVDGTKKITLTAKSNFDKLQALLTGPVACVIDKIRVKASAQEVLDATHHIRYSRAFQTDETLSFQPATYVDDFQNQGMQATIAAEIVDSPIIIGAQTVYVVEIPPMSTTTISLFNRMQHSNTNATASLLKTIPASAK